MQTRSGVRGRTPRSLALPQGVTRNAIERVEVLGLDKIQFRHLQASEQGENIAMSERMRALAQEAAAPVIRTERLGMALGPDRDPAVGDQGELEHTGPQVPKSRCKLIGGFAAPMEEDIHSDQLFSGEGTRHFDYGGAYGDGGFCTVAGRGETDGCLPDSSTHGIGESTGADAALALFWMEDIGGVDPVLQGLEPGVFDTGCCLNEPVVNQHLDGGLQEAGGVGTVLAGDIGGTAMDGLKKGAVLADIGRSRQAHRSRNLRRDIARAKTVLTQKASAK